ncbi:MAG: aminopeptidase P family protein, partial [Thermoanaerobaculia bacterium]
PGAFLAAWLAEALKWSGVAPGRVALAGSWPAGALVEATAALAPAGWSFVSGNEAMRRARRSKRPVEIDEIRRVTSAVGEAMRTVAGLLAAAAVRDGGELALEGEPLRVARLKREVALVFGAHGLAQPRANILAPGEEGGVPHSAGTPERILRAGESLIVDLFPKGTLFSDVTRTFCVGEPPSGLARAHADVRAALEQAHRLARPGASGWQLQEATCALLGARGWPTQISHPGTLTGYVHGLGHGVGYELHELPSFRKGEGEDGVLEVGDVVTLEPGLYDAGAGGFGVRLEDLVWLAPDGPESFTPWPYDLDPRAWAAG